MNCTRTDVGPTAPARRFARAAAVVLLTAWPWVSTFAQETLYQSAVPLKGTSEAERLTAFGQALRVAAVRATGRREAAQAPRVAAAAADPAGYVQQYSTTSDRMLHVGFDDKAMEQLLQQAGLPLWPAERPTVSVLLVGTAAAVDRTLTASERTPERSEVERVAQLRGVPVAWPTRAIDAGSARAQLATHAATLLGVVGAGSIDWTFAHAGQVVRGRGSAGDGIDLAADALAARYAPGSTRSLNTVDVRIGGLDGVRAYAALTRYLEDLSLVRSVSVREFDRDTAQFELAVRGDLELLRRIFALDRRLAPATAGDNVSAAAADFTWQH